MIVLPIVERELRAAARQWATYWARLGIALAAIFVTVVIFVLTFGLPSAQTGRRIFEWLAGIMMVYCLAYGRRSTSDCLSVEKREGTLGLLFLTDLKGHDVVLGKLVATSVRGFYGLLAVFPVLAIPLLLGGITSGEFWRVVLVLMDTCLFSLAIGILGSALSRDQQRAMAANITLLFALMVVPAACMYALEYLAPAMRKLPQLLFCCPPYAFYLRRCPLHGRPGPFLVVGGRDPRLDLAAGNDRRLDCAPLLAGPAFARGEGPLARAMARLEARPGRRTGRVSQADFGCKCVLLAGGPPPEQARPCLDLPRVHGCVVAGLPGGLRSRLVGPVSRCRDRPAAELHV